MSPGAVRPLCAGLVILTLLDAAPPKEDEKETVQVSVIAILATERDDKIDPKLACIAREVRKSHKKLTGFHLATMTCNKSLAVGVKEMFEVVGDQKVAVTVKESANEKNRVQVKVGPPQMGEITYDTCCGKFLPIVTPFRTKNHDLLIIAVRVQPCHGK
jgi:hypothetical protein